ncbi:Ankyrin repeat and SOCS box protein 3 [Merluccius polli]|uniref:Ankyrin repeat and SOCS box protein 3 n=1 Tax=Merluccius polli TaxID=89951 RepID=A0AA47MHD2_MERPO|nr:Ankyrin repeat and SOCS box protein 3 [Merluccius polli]
MYVNMKALKGQTALFLAAAKGHVDIVKLLVTAGANMNIKNASGLTPILAALSKNKPAVAKVLLRKGAEVNQTDASRQSCLHLASAQGSSELVSILVQICSIELRNDQEKTAIYLAAENGHQECLEILACAGANVDIQASDCTTPLMAATKTQSEECVEVLLKYGADPHVVCSNLWPQLAIHAAASLKNVNILKRLVAATSREVSYAAGHVSPVYEAVQQPEMLDVLLSEGFSPEAQPCDDIYDADSPLALVLSYVHDYGDEDDEDLLYSDSVKSLMRAGARLTQDCWKMCLEYLVVLDLLLDERCEAKGKGPGATRLLDGEEVEALQSVAALCTKEAYHWLPTLLKSGLDPAALLVPDFLMAAESDTLTYLLEMVNWSTLTRPLRHVLEQRQKLKTWTCPAHLESVPPLFHLCRLQLRTYLGPDVLMRSDVVSQLPVPSLLHGYLRFADITLPES